MSHCITQLRLSLLAVYARNTCMMDTFSEWLAARSGLLERMLSFLQCLDVSCAMLSPLLYVFTFSFQPFSYYNKIPGHKSWTEDRTVLKPHSPKMVSYASDFLYVTSFSFFGIWFLCEYRRKTWWLFRVS